MPDDSFNYIYILRLDLFTDWHQCMGTVLVTADEQWSVCLPTQKGFGKLPDTHSLQLY